MAHFAARHHFETYRSRTLARWVPAFAGMTRIIELHCVESLRANMRGSGQEARAVQETGVLMTRSRLVVIALVTAIVAACGMVLFPFVLVILFPHLKFQ